MIVYDGKKWTTLFSTIYKTFKESYNLKKLLRFILYTAIYAAIVTLMHLELGMGVFVIDKTKSKNLHNNPKDRRSKAKEARTFKNQDTYKKTKIECNTLM